MLGVIVKNRPFFVVFQPMVAWYQSVVLVHFTVPLLPVVEFARSNADPLHQSAGAQLGSVAPLSDVIDDFVLVDRLGLKLIDLPLLGRFRGGLAFSFKRGVGVLE